MTGSLGIHSCCCCCCLSQVHHALCLMLTDILTPLVLLRGFDEFIGN
jgi:hypothetical protein